MGEARHGCADEGLTPSGWTRAHARERGGERPPLSPYLSSQLTLKDGRVEVALARLDHRRVRLLAGLGVVRLDELGHGLENANEANDLELALLRARRPRITRRKALRWSEEGMGSVRLVGGVRMVGWTAMGASKCGGLTTARWMDACPGVRTARWDHRRRRCRWYDTPSGMAVTG